MERQLALGLFLSVLLSAAALRQEAPSVLSAEDKKTTSPAVRSDFIAAARNPETKTEFKTLQEVVKEPQEEIISLGKKKTIRTGEFPRCGRVDYYGRMRVWATSYDKYCTGCLGVTYTGLPAGYGTVAVDPKVIPLYSRICIPGYGVAIAGDIGGGIKGDKIDLGFDNVKEGWWSARWTEIYLLP